MTKIVMASEFIKEFHFLRSIFGYIADDVFYHTLRKLHIVLKIGKGDFGFDHPEFGGVAGGV